MIGCKFGSGLAPKKIHKGFFFAITKWTNFCVNMSKGLSYYEWRKEEYIVDKKKIVDIIVPCYQEEGLVDVFYDEVMRYVKLEEGYEFQFLFVDDGSRDGTLGEMRELEAKQENVSYLSFSRNFGKEAAMYAGMEYASGDYITIMDVDLQDDPKMIGQMLRAMEEGYDCCGVRRKDRKGEPFIKSVLAQLFYKVMNRFSDVTIVSGARDFRMMTAGMKDAVLMLQERERFSKGIFAWVGFRYQWLEYKNIPRTAGYSKWSLWRLIRYAVDGILSFSNAPLHILMGTGAVISVLSFLFMLIKILKVLLFGIDVHGYASTVVLICFFGGLNLFAVGLVGEYLGRVNTEVKQRPLYIVRDKKLKSGSVSNDRTD